MKVIAYASDVIEGDTLTDGVVIDIEENDGLLTLVCAPYVGSTVENAVTLRPNALVTRVV
jgi:predicted transcriptional regulator